MPVFHLDGKPVEFEPGEKILSAALRAGFQIPHYCYHPAFSVVATCRMCVVDIVDMGNGRPAPKLQTSCSMDAVDGMKVESKNEKVREARQLVLEFLLINHPLDCPVCDQSGECVLQDYSYDYGSGQSEMEYSKRVYGWRDIGTFVALERNRCIHCSRCDRFTREITGTNEFGMFNRGHELTIDTYSDRPMTNRFQGNMADLCPVGAITEKEFRFKRRAWKLRKSPSICTGCSTGCNVTIEYDKNEVFRLKPRENQQVNQWWMCDAGRLTYRIMNEQEKRILTPLARKSGELREISWEDAVHEVSERVKELSPASGEVLAFTDTHASNEEMFLLKKLMAECFHSDAVYFPSPAWEQPQSDFIIDSLITTDHSPNRAGAMLLGLQGNPDNAEIVRMLENPPKVLLMLGSPFDEEQVLSRVGKIPLVVYIGTLASAWSETADVVIPGQLHSEKEVTYTNKNGRVQQTFAAIRPPWKSRPEWETLRGIMSETGNDPGWDSASSVFSAIAGEVPAFRGLDFAELGPSGKPVSDEHKDPGRILTKAETGTA